MRSKMKSWETIRFEALETMRDWRVTSLNREAAIDDTALLALRDRLFPSYTEKAQP